MRLFLAVPIDRSRREALETWREAMTQDLVRGRPVNSDNFHITMVFLGEVDQARLKAIVEAVQAALLDENPTDFVFTRIDAFTRGSEHLIYAAGDSVDARLKSIYISLYEAIKSLGFTLDRRRFKPHITLLRRAITTSEPKRRMAPLRIPIDAIVLYESRREHGHLRYIELERFLLVKPSPLRKKDLR